MGTIAPDGYLTCDGTVLNVADYPKLANHFETQFGSKSYFGGDGETTFAVPDLRNEFLRGYGELSNNVGVHQEATEIPHIWVYSANTTTYGIGPNVKVGEDNIVENADTLNMVMTSETQAKRTYLDMGTKASSYYTKDINDAIGGSRLAHSYTSRPTNVAVLYCIKY